MPDVSTPTAARERRRTTTNHGTAQDKLFEQHRSSGRLGYMLAWGVVFADIGTSIYYVPGLLFGELGGILICVDYFLTGAISSVTGFDYLAGAVHQIEPWLVPLSCGAIFLLG